MLNNRTIKAYFYPRSPCGERRHTTASHIAKFKFLSTLSLRRATSKSLVFRRVYRYFYPRSPCGERPILTMQVAILQYYFYPRSPCGERRGKVTNEYDQSDFYPRSPCGERRPIDVPQYQILDISIHALLAESDQSRAVSHQTARKFLSTLSLRRATRESLALLHHADNFYPRSPCGERRLLACSVGSACSFLSTLSLRRATTLSQFVTDFVFVFLSTLSLRRATASQTNLPSEN